MYCNSVWSPYRKSDIEALEKVQKRATKILPPLKHLKYSEPVVLNTAGDRKGPPQGTALTTARDRNRHIPQGITARDYRDHHMQGTPTTTECADGMVAIKNNITWTNRLVED